MEYIRSKSDNIQKAGIHFLFASIEAVGLLFLFAKITNRTIEQLNSGWTLLLYVLLVVLILLVFGRKEQ